MAMEPGTRPMRRKDRQLGDDAAREILRGAEYGVLSLAGDGEGPYGVPLSFVWQGGTLYFHCAREGRKIDCLRANDHVSFCAVRGVQAVYDGSFSTYYQSAVVAGRAAEVTGEEEKRSALLALCEKYLPGEMDRAQGDIAKSFAATAVWKIVPEAITGKAKAPKG